MQAERIFDLIDWIAETGLAGADELELLDGFCRRALVAGIPLRRGLVGMDTLHPVLEGRVFAWQRDTGTVTQSDYQRSAPDTENEKWLNSPFFFLIESGQRHLRRKLELRNAPFEFPVLDDLRAQGVTDYLALLHPFGADSVLGRMDGLFSSWTTDQPGGFEDWQIAALERLVAHLAQPLKALAIGRIADTLVDTYLGRDAGHRVLAGHIERGVAERIPAVLWNSDLQGFTRITDTVPPEQVIPLLNAYADVIVSAVHDNGGQVIKFIGDGILANFAVDDPEAACCRALDAAEQAQERVKDLNRTRKADGLPVTRFYLGIHVGEVFYGNIGSVERLDFTVIGPAVNEVSRIGALCRSLDQDVLLSSAFAAAAGRHRCRLVSVGRYALRGVQRPQELFTLDPEAPSDHC
jgi:adenylate cyclase